MNATELRNKRSTLVTEARQIMRDIEGTSDQKRLADLEKRHDAVMAEFDQIDNQLQRHERTEQQERLDANYRAGRRDADDDARRNSMRPNPGDGEASGVDAPGRTLLDQLRRDDPAEAVALRSGESFVDFIRNRSERSRHGDDADEYRGLSEGAYLRSMIIGPKTDVEKRALAEGTDSAGGYTVPDVLSARMIDRMRANAVIFRAGAQVVPLTSDVSYIAKVVSDPTPAWRTENAAIAESDPTFGRVTLTARSLAVLVKVSRELLEDSLNMETALPDVLASAMGLELDRVALFGTGVAPQPRGVANFTALTSAGAAVGDLTSYSPLIRARTALRTVNSDVTGYVMSPRDEGHLSDLTDTTGQPLNIPPKIATIPQYVTSSVPTNLGGDTDESVILAGDWRRLLIGVRTELRIEVLREAFAGNHQYAFVAHLRADVAAEHEAAFTKLTGITIPE